MSLIDSDASEPTTTDSPAARLGSATSFLTLLDPPPPAARLDLVPQKVLQREEPAGWARKLRRRTIPFFSTVVIHLGFAAAFAFLLTWREDTGRREVEIPVEQSVNLREEHVTLERRPMDRAVSESDLAFGDRTIELTETAEEAVISKNARVVEEVLVGKQASEHVETIHDTVRKTEVEVEQVPATETFNSTRRTN